MMGCTNLVELL